MAKSPSRRATAAAPRRAARTTPKVTKTAVKKAAPLLDSPMAKGQPRRKSDYSARDIEVLEGLEPVRRRPAMYIGGSDERAMHHLASEALDNAMDEAVAGHANWIEFDLAGPPGCGGGGPPGQGIRHREEYTLGRLALCCSQYAGNSGVISTR